MITLNIQSSDFQRATNRARVFHNHVSRKGERAYKVRSGNTATDYTVRFFLVQGEKKAACSCRAGQEDLLCHHVASALTVHVALAAQAAADGRLKQQASESANSQKPRINHCGSDRTFYPKQVCHSRSSPPKKGSYEKHENREQFTTGAARPAPRAVSV